MAKKKKLKIVEKTVKVGSLRPYPGNARKGNVKMIADSLEAHGQYRRILVQKSTGYILAGNHTWLGHKAKNFDDIDITEIDVNDDEARKIVLVDNRTNDVATYDQEGLAALLSKSLSDLDGTGYDSETANLIVQAVAAGSDDNAASLDEILSRVPQGADDGDADFGDPKGFHVTGGDGDEYAPRTQEEQQEEDDFDDALGELQGILQLATDMVFPAKNSLGIPDLRVDMLVEAMPTPLDTWGGKEATPDDGKTIRVWNYGTSSSSGLAPERTLLSFYTYDEKFDGWWAYPDFYTAKALNKGVKMAIVPDFSIWVDQAPIENMWGVYRAQWLGRYFQEAGIKVIPRINFGFEDSYDYSWLGIPKKAPVAAYCMQTVDRSETNIHEMMRKGLVESLKRLDYQSLIVYGGKLTHEIVTDLNLPIPVKLLENYAAKRRGTVFDKKEGLASKRNKAKKKAKDKEEAE